MNAVDTAILSYIHQRLASGAGPVTEAEIMDAIIPADYPEYRERPGYRYAMRRLLRRGKVSCWPDAEGQLHYSFGQLPPPASPTP